jgi:hypothetical protein
MEGNSKKEKKSTEENRPKTIMNILIGLKAKSKICRRD